MRRFVECCGAMLVLAGCGGESTTVDAGPVDSGGVDAGLVDGGGMDSGGGTGVDAGGSDGWEPCAQVSGTDGLGAECRVFALPEDHESASEETLDVWVKRVPGGGRAGQLWLLAGGPGGASADLEVALRGFQARSGGMDIYFLDHRGVGRSSRLGCPTAEADASPGGRAVITEEIPSCYVEGAAAIGERSAVFSVTNAAHDLGRLIEELREPDEPVFVYGLSYGTFWAHRYLRLYPEQPTGVILDSICSPGECRMPRGFARNHDQHVRELLRRCGEDTACAAAMEEDPLTVAERAMQRADTGTCPGAFRDGFGPNELRFAIGVLSAGPNTRGAVPAVYKRLDRCDADDQVALQVLADLITTASPPTPAQELGSPLLGGHILRSELWDMDGTQDELDAFVGSLIAASGPASLPSGTHEAFTPYPEPALATGFATTSVPMLMMNGTLDPQTPLAVARPMASAFTGPGQTFVELDRAAHFVLFGSAYADDVFDSCGWDLMQQFIADPTATPSTGCSGDGAALDFADDSVASFLFGTRSLFSGGASEGERPPVDPERARRIIDELRRSHL